VRRRAALAAAGLGLLLAACGGGGAPPALAGQLKVPVGDAPQRGPSDAWVTVIEFSDFECPYCAAAEPLVEQLLADRPADLRLLYHHFPLTSLHPAALPAAEATECARLQPQAGTADGFFWDYHDALFAHHGELVANDGAPMPFLGALAGGIAGLDFATWQACMTAHATRARIQADQAVAQGSYGIYGTPTFVVNGTPVLGAGGLQAAVDAALTRAIQSGLPRAQYYDKAVLGL
jgi:protein-disulfide isomerase